MNRSLELQKLIMNSIKNIDYIKDNINIFSSIPDKIKTPYIKISSITANSTENNCRIQKYSIELAIFTRNKNNRNILEIMDSLYENIYNATINQDIAEYNYITTIYNIYNTKYSISEDLQNGFWKGTFYFDIDLI